MERLHDACGIVGIYARENGDNIDVRRYLTLALTALQHRGQESAGMAVYNQEGRIVSRASMGKVREAFSDMGTDLPESHCGIGHVRYSTTGSSCVENAGPFVVGAWRGHHETGAPPRRSQAAIRTPTCIFGSCSFYLGYSDRLCIVLILLELVARANKRCDAMKKCREILHCA